MSAPAIDLLNVGVSSSPSVSSERPDSDSAIRDVERIPDRRTSYLQRNEARLFALSILRNDDYKKNLLTAAIKRTLPPAIEVALMHYGWGKPADRVELGAPGAFSNDLSDLSLSELADRSKNVVHAIVALEYANASPEEQRLIEDRAKHETNEAIERRKATELEELSRKASEGHTEGEPDA